jgi:hypothetical protein
MDELTTDRNDPDLGVKGPDGQNKKYLILSGEERAKGFVRPLYRAYLHRKCGSVTTMGLELCETYARNPNFYTATFCVHCGAHFALKDETGDWAFIWDKSHPELHVGE